MTFIQFAPDISLQPTLRRGERKKGKILEHYIGSPRGSMEKLERSASKEMLDKVNNIDTDKPNTIDLKFEDNKIDNSTEKIDDYTKNNIGEITDLQDNNQIDENIVVNEIKNETVSVEINKEANLLENNAEESSEQKHVTDENIHDIDQNISHDNVNINTDNNILNVDLENNL